MSSIFILTNLRFCRNPNDLLNLINCFFFFFFKLQNKKLYKMKYHLRVHSLYLSVHFGFAVTWLRLFVFSDFNEGLPVFEDPNTNDLFL